MSKLIIYVSFIIYLWACNNSKSVTNTSRHSNSVNSNAPANGSLKKDINISPHDTLLLNIGCYYKLDDKYSESEDTTEINNWWQEKLIEFERNGFQNNLFANEGGGPSGAEWNSSTDLYIAATIGKILKDETIELELNKKKVSGVTFLKYIPINKIGTIIYFKLPKALWEKNLRKIKANDFEGIYGKENIKSLKKNQITLLMMGKVVEITINIKKNKSSSFTLSDFFHVAYGE